MLASHLPDGGVGPTECSADKTGVPHGDVIVYEEGLLSVPLGWG